MTKDNRRIQVILKPFQLQCLIVNRTNFTVKISVCEICFITESHHNMHVLLGGIFFAAQLLKDKYRRTKQGTNLMFTDY